MGVDSGGGRRAHAEGYCWGVSIVGDIVGESLLLGSFYCWGVSIVGESLLLGILLGSLALRFSE